MQFYRLFHTGQTDKSTSMEHVYISVYVGGVGPLAPGACRRRRGYRRPRHDSVALAQHLAYDSLGSGPPLPDIAVCLAPPPHPTTLPSKFAFSRVC